MVHKLLLFVMGLQVSSIEMNCGNLNSPVSAIDTLYINSRDTIYRFDTVFSKDTVYVETLLVSRSVYIDTAGNSYSKILAFKGRVGDLPFETDSVATVYSIRISNNLGFGQYDTAVYWSTMTPVGTWQIIDTVDSGTITYGHYILDTGVPIDSGWIIVKASFCLSQAYMHKDDISSYSYGNSSIRMYYNISSWLQDDTSPARNPGSYEFVLVCPIK